MCINGKLISVHARVPLACLCPSCVVCVYACVCGGGGLLVLMSVYNAVSLTLVSSAI